MKIRKAKVSDSRQIANIHVKTWQSAYKYIVDRKYLKNLSVKRSAKVNKKNIRDPNIISLVAENDCQQIVGFLFGGENRYKNLAHDYQGEIYGIYILEEYSRQGLGKMLIKEFFSILKQKKIYSVHVMFLAGNEAEHFYYSLGARYVTSTDYEIGGQVYMVHSYGWQDISLLNI
ncbi:MAG: N-acetyltransferase family protein [Clostridia bacterium]